MHRKPHGSEHLPNTVFNLSLAWMPDGSRLLSVGDPWTGHTYQLPSSRRTIAIFKSSSDVYCVAFSMNGKYIISRSVNKKVSQWVVPGIALLEDSPQERVIEDVLLLKSSSEQ